MSSQLILWECSTCLKAAFLGMILAAVYYMLRIFRRLVPHKKLWVINVEDLLFWICTGVVLFAYIYKTSSGIIRAFQIGGFIGGAALFIAAFGKVVLKMGTKIVHILFKPLIILCKKVKILIIKVKGRGHETGNKKGKSH